MHIACSSTQQQQKKAADDRGGEEVESGGVDDHEIHAQRVRAHGREIMMLLHLGLAADLLASVLVCSCERVSAPAEQRRDMDQASFVNSTVSQKPGRVDWVVRYARYVSGCSGRSGVDASPVTL